MHQLSADGSLVLLTAAYLDGVVNPGAPPQVVVLDRTSGTYDLVSRRPDGAPGNAASGFAMAMTPDGRYVTFSSNASDLVAGDTNAVTDVFVRDRVLGQTLRVSLTASGAERLLTSGSPGISADGAVIGFVSDVPAACADFDPTDPDCYPDRRSRSSTVRCPRCRW